MSDIRIQADSKFGGCVIVTDGTLGPEIIVQSDDGDRASVYLDINDCERIGKALMAIALLHQVQS